MARYDLIVGTYDTYKWFLHFFLSHSQCIKKGTMRCLLHTAFNIITLHSINSFLKTLIASITESQLQWHHPSLCSQAVCILLT